MALRDRASGIMDFIGRMGADLVTPPQSSPVMQGRSPLQMTMNRPEVQFSQPNANAMVTTMPDGTMAMASPTPQIRQEMTGAGVTGPRMNPPQVVSARPEGLEPNRLMGPRGPVGSGVSMTGPQLEQARLASQVVEEVQKTPEIQNDPTFMDGVRSYFGDRENMVRLALAFNSMRTRPDTGLASVLGDELKDLRTQTRAQSTRNATANWLRSQNREDLANLVEQGMIDGKKATELFMGQTGQVVTSAQLKQKYPGIEIEDGLYNIKADGTMNKVGGGGVSVQVGGPEAIQPGLEAAGKEIFKQDIEGATQASTALGNIAKTDEVLRLLDEGVPVTGLTAPIQDIINNARAMLGDEEAIKKASDTGLLNALLGQEVFGSITALGIGARGLDTPAEREFLREVMAGTINMNEETIRKIAELRRKYATEVIRKYNEKVESGDYDMLNQTFNNRYGKIEVPDKPVLKIPPVPAILPQGVTPEMWPEVYRNMSPADRALF